jgi:hypothetical protein
MRHNPRNSAQYHNVPGRYHISPSLVLQGFHYPNPRHRECTGRFHGNSVSAGFAAGKQSLSEWKRGTHFGKKGRAVCSCTAGILLFIRLYSQRRRMPYLLPLKKFTEVNFPAGICIIIYSWCMKYKQTKLPVNVVGSRLPADDRDPPASI